GAPPRRAPCASYDSRSQTLPGYALRPRLRLARQSLKSTGFPGRAWEPGKYFVKGTMQIARVVGHGISTVKHPSLHGWRLLIVQPLTPDGQDAGAPLLAIDTLGGG